MSEKHPKALKQMRAEHFEPAQELLMGKDWVDFQMLLEACRDPRRFPVHVLADEHLVRLIRKVKRGEKWVFAATIGDLFLKVVQSSK